MSQSANDNLTIFIVSGGGGGGGGGEEATTPQISVGAKVKCASVNSLLYKCALV